MAIVRSVVFTIICVVAISWVLASLAPPHWVFGELLLVAASMALVRRYLIFDDDGVRILNSGRSPVPANSAWFAGQSDALDARLDVYDPWDFAQLTAKPSTIAPTLLANDPRQSVEQIAHEILMQAFR